MPTIKNDIDTAKDWATSHLVIAIVIAAVVGFAIGLLVG